MFLALLVSVAACGRGASDSPGTGSVGPSWSPPTTNTDGSPLNDLAGYYVYVGTEPINLTRLIAISDPKMTTSTVKDLTLGAWYFAVTAVNGGGSESARSKIVSKTIQ